jgi:hypothetical protein
VPHDGRHYPYLPFYWATEAWFWPGFVPWRMIVEQLDTTPPFWGCSLVSSIPPSLPGATNPDCTEVSYQFESDGFCLVSGFNLTMRRTGVPGAFKAVWNVQSFYWDGSSETQDLEQSYPQRVVESPAFVIHVPSLDPGPAIRMRGHFLPANYEEGGSPYP